MKKNLFDYPQIWIALAVAWLCHAAFGSDVLVSFTPNAHDEAMGIVRTYSLWMQPTNAPDKNVHTWVTQVPINTATSTFTTITVNVTNLPINCYLFVTADGMSQTGVYSDPLFYDYPALLATVKPQKVTGVNIALKP